MLEKDSSPIYKNKTKKERHMLKREKLKLSDLHRGIKDMKHLPSALFVVDANHEKIAVAEAKCLGIPTFGLVDINTNPNSLDFPIPANDDSIKTIKLIMSHISESILESVGGTQNGNSDETPVVLENKGPDKLESDSNSKEQEVVEN